MLYPCFIVAYFIDWVTNSWTYSILEETILVTNNLNSRTRRIAFDPDLKRQGEILSVQRSLNPFYLVTYYIKWVKTSLIYSIT